MKLLIIEEGNFKKSIEQVAQAERFDVFVVSSCKDALMLIPRQEPHVVFCAAHEKTFIQHLQLEYPHIVIVVLTVVERIAEGFEALEMGAFEYFLLGVEEGKLPYLLHKVAEWIRLHHQVRKLEKGTSRKYSFQNMLGEAPPFLYAIEKAQNAANTDEHGYLVGEMGTGKEVFAQAIHQASTRQAKPFFALNCLNFSEQALEFELFEYKHGIAKDRQGLLQEAHLGTLFLDEIHHMSWELQGKLAEVLASKQCRGLPTDLRLIVASTQTLAEAKASGHLCSELIAHVQSFEIALPALRDRKEDIPLLVGHFLRKYGSKTGKQQVQVDEEFLQKLAAYTWAGNIRELKNIIERATLLATHDRLTVACLPLELR